jgi:hypothetical protein
VKHCTAIRHPKSGECIFPKQKGLTRSVPTAGVRTLTACCGLCVINLATRLYCSHLEAQAGLFALVVANFVFFSYPLLHPDPTDTTNQLLTQISQQLSSNGTGSSQFSANESSFQPPAFAIRVNILWFASLAMSTACALWATLMQQWTRKYVHMADRPCAPPRRARIHAVFADGVEKFALAATAQVLAGLLHASVLLFYSGLVDFLIHENLTLGYAMLTWVVIGCLTYFILTIMPLFYPNSPYETPLSSLCWLVMEATPLLGLWLRRRNETVETAIREHQTNIGKGMRQALELKAAGLTSWANAIKALEWTMVSLDGEDELVDFLDGVPGLFHGFGRHHPEGLRLKGRLETLVKPVADKLFATCATGFLPEKLQRQRLMACLKAIWCFYGTIDLHFRAIWEQWDRVNNNNPWGPLSTETWTVASNMTMDLDPFVALRAHCIQALMAVMWKKGKWHCAPPEATALLQRQLGASSFDINRWHTSGDQLQLAVAANLLTNSLPLLQELETGADTTLKIELKAILDTICGELDASDVPHELQTRFAKGAEVMNVFNIQDVGHHSPGRVSFDLDGPWTKIFTPVDIN